MKSWILGLLIAVFLGVMSCAGICQALDQPEVTTDSGVRLIEFQNAQDWGFRAEWFDNYDAENTSFFDYNDTGGTSTTHGEVDTSFIYDKGNIQVSIPTFGTGTVTIRAEGKTLGSSIWAEIFTKAYTAATTIAESFPITTYYNKVRVGVKVTGSAVDAVNVDAEFITQKKQY
jgi:hypothetical protein